MYIAARYLAGSLVGMICDQLGAASAVLRGYFISVYQAHSAVPSARVRFELD